MSLETVLRRRKKGNERRTPRESWLVEGRQTLADVIPQHRQGARSFGSVSPFVQGLAAALLIAAVFAAYWPCMHGGFVWDDDAWTIHLRELFEAPDAVWRIWTQPTAMQQYYPLTGTTFWLDHQMWGAWTFPYHVQNVLWHGLAALLFTRILRQLRVPGNWMAGALFALHPVMVESVAWLAERKNVLSMALFLGALSCFVRYRGAWEAEDGVGGRRWYWGALALFAMALLAKVTAYVFPPTVLLLCWWKQGRIRKRDIVELTPFFVLSLVLGGVVSWVEKHHVGAAGAEWDMAFGERVLHAGRALWFYPGKLLWPADLRFMYPRWRLDGNSLAAWLWPIAVFMVAGAMWWWRARISRGVFTAVFFYLGTVFPVLGFMNVYGMKFASVADHWNYLPSLAVFALAGAALVHLAQLWRAPWLTPAAAAVVLPVLAVLTAREAAQYRDVETLWLSTAARDPSHWMPQYSLGLHYSEQGRLQEALTRYSRSLELRPNHPLAYSNVGVVLDRLGRTSEAVAFYREAIKRGSNLSHVHHNLAMALVRTGALDEAVVEVRDALAAEPLRAEFHLTLASIWMRKRWADRAEESARRAVELQPGNAAARLALGIALYELRRLPEAASEFRQAVANAPDNASAHGNLAAVLLDLDHPSEAMKHSAQALALNPESASAYSNRGLAALRLGRYAEALRDFGEALRRTPALPQALAHSALILAASPEAGMRNGRRALELAREAERLTHGQNALALRAVAAARAEQSDYAGALEALERARVLMDSAIERDRQDFLREATLYGSGAPLRLPVAQSEGQ